MTISNQNRVPLDLTIHFSEHPEDFADQIRAIAGGGPDMRICSMRQAVGELLARLDQIAPIFEQSGGLSIIPRPWLESLRVPDRENLPPEDLRRGLLEGAQKFAAIHKLLQCQVRPSGSDFDAG